MPSKSTNTSSSKPLKKTGKNIAERQIACGVIKIECGLLNGQVLQRRRDQTGRATVHGSIELSGTIWATICESGKLLKSWRLREVGRAAKGRFSARIAGIPVGGPYDIQLFVIDSTSPTAGDPSLAALRNVARAGRSITIRDIWVGDVWLLAGQSNMQGLGNLRTAPKPHPLVHALYMDGHWGRAKEPIHFLPSSSDPVHYELTSKNPLLKEARDKLLRATVKGVGPGVFFGKEMVKRSGGVPQGLLCTAQGGTSMEQWAPGKKNLGGHSLYGSMLRTWQKIGPQPVAGIVWYQGESDCKEVASSLYTRRMKQFVTAIRRDLKQPKLPFLLVQIGKVFGTGQNAKYWNSIQNQQIQLKESIRNYDVVTAIDLPLDDFIHIGTEGCQRLGARLTRLADRMALGNRKERPAPELVSLSTKATKSTKGICAIPITLKFKNVVGGLRAEGTPTGFTIVDDKNQDLRLVYKTTIRENVVELETLLDGNSEERFLVYGYGLAPYVNITDARDMAIPAFRVQIPV